MNNENLHFDDESKQVVSFFPLRNFLKEIENMFFSSYRLKHLQNLGELEKVMKHSPVGSCSHSISHFPKL